MQAQFGAGVSNDIRKWGAMHKRAPINSNAQYAPRQNELNKKIPESFTNKWFGDKHMMQVVVLHSSKKENTKYR